jgi:hypothetical protein
MCINRDLSPQQSKGLIGKKLFINKTPRVSFSNNGSTGQLFILLPASEE